MTGDLVTQATWAKQLGVSTTTFRQWRALGLIPLPLDLPGYPRWSREVVERTTARLTTLKRGLFGRIQNTHRQQRSGQSRPSRFQQGQRPAHGALVADQAVSQSHAESVREGVHPDQSNSVVGAR